MSIHKVAVVGAGAAGLAVGRHLRHDFGITIYERREEVGGTWIYSPLHGPDVNARVDSSTHAPSTSVSAIYDSLHTNLPPTLMQYQDTPFPTGTQTFPPHNTVLRYLQDYAQKFFLEDLIRFGTEVVRCRWDSALQKWFVSHRICASGQVIEETYDAVIVASGHFSKPYVPAIPAMEVFPNRIIHTQNYRRPDEFRDKNVIVVGGASSGIDIMREVARVASTVYLSLKDPDSVGDIGESLETLATNSQDVWSSGSESSALARVLKKGVLKNFGADGRVDFEDGSIAEHVDAVIFATGYLYDFPYLHPDELSGGEWLFGTDSDGAGVTSVEVLGAGGELSTVLTTDGHCVHNLYKLIFYIPNPTLSFVGLPLKVCPFPLFEYQAQLIRHTYLNPETLPPTNIMRQSEHQSTKHHMGGGEVQEGTKRQMVLGSPEQYEYWNSIAQSIAVRGVDIPKREEERKEVLVLRRKVLGY